MRKVWLAAEQDKGAFGAFIKFTLLTATRRGESAALRRSELSDGGATWIIPGAKYKNGKDHLIPLSPAARAIVAAMPVLAGGDHVFSATGTNPLGAWAKRKKAFDKACGVSGWRLHDLRRTARTCCSAVLASVPTMLKCVSVTPWVACAATYDRHEYRNEKRHAFEALAALVERIVHPPSDVVVPMKSILGLSFFIKARIELGDATKATPWTDHVHRRSVDHLMFAWWRLSACQRSLLNSTSNVALFSHHRAVA